MSIRKKSDAMSSRLVMSWTRATGTCTTVAVPRSRSSSSWWLITSGAADATKQSTISGGGGGGGSMPQPQRRRMARCVSACPGETIQQGITSVSSTTPVSLFQPTRGFASASSTSSATVSSFDDCHDADADNGISPASASSSSTSTSTSTYSSRTPFLLADIGEGIAEVEVMQWFVAEGDSVRQFDRVCEVQSDKATVEITSRYDGIVESLQGRVVGDMIKVGTPLMFITTIHTSTTNTSNTNTNTTARMEHEPQWEDDDDDDEEESAAASTNAEYDNAEYDDDECEHANIAGLFDVDDVHHQETQENNTMRHIIPSADTNHAMPYLPPSCDTITAPSQQTKVLTSPAVRKLAKEHGIHLPSVIGRGPKGRILKEDVLRIIEAHQQPATMTSTESDSTLHPRKEEAPSLVPGGMAHSQHRQHEGASASNADENQTQDEHEHENEDTVIPLRGYNRLMYRTMTKSLQVPHMMFGDEVVMDKLMETRDMVLKQQNSNSHSNSHSNSSLMHRHQLPKLTYLPFFIKAASLALTEYPLLNSSLRDDNPEDEELELSIVQHGQHHIGVAMDTPRGLVVAVVHHCETRSILEIQQELVRLELAGSAGSLQERDVAGATFALSNIGAIGGTYMQPVVVPPAVAIGAMGKIRKIPTFDDLHHHDKVTPAHVMNVSWAADHRVVDGATLARFSNAWKAYLEQPSLMLFTMK
jgi:2-oxoisovalerate dehydrogenase E2 component (dihydrolipoyl transacylase)